jgi:hypothetical protein
MELWVGAGLACMGLAVGIGQWLVPPDKLGSKTRFGLTSLAVVLALVGVCLIAYAVFQSKQTPIITDAKSAGSLDGQNSSGAWRSLTDADRTRLSLMFSDGSLHKVRIYRTPTPDCIRLADDFYKFFDQLQWMQTHRPESPHDWEIPPGIYVATIPDNVPTGKIKNIKERSGAIALIKGIESIGLPVISDHWSGNVDDLEIHLHIGVKPE